MDKSSGEYVGEPIAIMAGGLRLSICRVVFQLEFLDRQALMASEHASLFGQ